MAITPELKDAIILDQDRFVWEAPAYEHYERGPKWYVLMTVAATLLVAYAIWTANFLFAFIILLVAIILVLAGNEEPTQTLVQIGDVGIVWNGHLILFQELDRFCMIYHPPHTKILYLYKKTGLQPRLRILLEDQDPLEVRDHLKRYIPEDLDLQEEHLSDILARLLRI